MKMMFEKIVHLQEEVARNKAANTARESPTEERRPLPFFPSLNSPLSEHFPTRSLMTTMPFTPIDGHIGASNHTPPLNTNQIPGIAHSIPSYPAPQNTHPGITIQPNMTPLLTDKSSPINETHPAVSFHTPITPGTFLAYQEIDHYDEMKKAWKAEQEKQKKRLEQKMTAMLERSMRTTLTGTGLSYDDLCMHPNLDLPEGFKVPGFKLFNGTGNPKAHLRAYCDQLEDMAEAFMERFRFNMETVPDRYYLEKVKQKSTENFCEYASRWRTEVACVQPPMGEEELVSVFIRSQETNFYDIMLSMA
ncbi:uncharacterized protein LOC132601368 [Lycium barbarum]|uniref:uncharacterized protein LOC132601368 n=1 Tax=Lycium barbarum TaxID=112863 RepID=UPI00293F68CF|nr:uncharacterized protein LOC132601368 [Lycium barbarum]